MAGGPHEVARRTEALEPDRLRHAHRDLLGLVLGRPEIAPNNPLDAHTRIYLDGPHHHFLVEEWRNDYDGKTKIHNEVCRLTSQIDMVDKLHPLMIEGMQTHLSGPEAWQTIIDELDSRLDRYVNAK